MHKPKLFHKIYFWIVLGFLSTFFAETFSGSSPDFLFKAFGYFGIIPIYLLHSGLLATLVMQRGGLYSLRTLYFVSLLFGMYEAYITKVLWSPPWNPETLHISGIALAETTLLVFFWHSVFSFLLPIFWIESLAIPSPHLPALLPEKWRARLICKRGALLTGLIGGVLAGTSVGNLPQALIYLLVDCLVLSLLVFLLERSNRETSYNLKDLLPRRGEVIVLAVLLLVVYLLFGLFLRRDVQPGIAGHAAVLLLYAAIVFLIIRSMRKDRQQMAEDAAEPPQSPGYTFKNWSVLCASLTLSGAVVSLIPIDTRSVLAGIILLSCTLAGVALSMAALVSLFRKDTGAPR